MLSRANFLKLDVYFASLKQELVALQKAYGPLNFLSKCWILFFIIMHISRIQYREYSIYNSTYLWPTRFTHSSTSGQKYNIHNFICVQYLWNCEQSPSYQFVSYIGDFYLFVWYILMKYQTCIISFINRWCWWVHGAFDWCQLFDSVWNTGRVSL